MATNIYLDTNMLEARLKYIFYYCIVVILYKNS